MTSISAIVKTLMGDVEGSKSLDFNGNDFYQFLGIPYAKPPVGDLRFKDPYPLDSWTGVLDAKADGNQCYQKDFLTQIYGGSEDCLYLNVFTRELPDESENLKPVMVFIHGGAFIFGSNSCQIYGPDYLLTEDIVLVTINYRIGLLGFLRIKDPNQHVYGNMGFKDQVAALRWVRNNIMQFNGDPNNVTIFGESAGAASVHYHILSPLSKGLFHKAILQSGSALSPWSDECDHSAIQIARTKNSKVQTETEALEYLRGLTVEKLLELQNEFILEKVIPGAMRPIGLVIENSPKNVAFISKRPIDIITSGDYNKVPIILGYNDREGIIFNHSRKLTGDPRENLVESYIPYNVNFRANIDLKRKYIEKLKNFYFKGNDENDSFISIMSDAWFVCGIIGSAKNHTLTSGYPVYLYKISLDTKLNGAKNALNLTDIPGCSHGDELSYLFKTTALPTVEADSEEELCVRRLLKLWTNFAKYGNPTPEEKELGIIWKPVKARQINVLNIGNEQLKMEINPDSRNIDLWKEIFSQSTSISKYL